MASASSSTQPTTTTITQSKRSVLTVLNKRLEDLRNQRTEILQLELSRFNGNELNSKQVALVDTKSVILARIDELEKIRPNVSAAVDEERKEVEDMVVERYKDGNRPVH